MSAVEEIVTCAQPGHRNIATIQVKRTTRGCNAGFLKMAGFEFFMSFMIWNEMPAVVSSLRPAR